MESYSFSHYLTAGHGRAYLTLKKNPEKYREIIMDACKSDFTFEVHSEGSRAFLMSDIIRVYEDSTPFLKIAIDSFNKLTIDDKTNSIRYLSDLLSEFGEMTTIYYKYKSMIDEAMIMPCAALKEHSNWVRDNIEYIAITLVQHTQWEIAEEVIMDIGRLNHLLNDRMDTRFQWLQDEMIERYGSQMVLKKQSQLVTESPELYEYYGSYKYEDAKYGKAAPPSLDEILNVLNSNGNRFQDSFLKLNIREIKSKDIRGLAELSVKTKSLEKRAVIVGLYDYNDRWKWPLDTSYLIDWSLLGNEFLQRSCHRAMSNLISEDIRKYSISFLRTGFDTDCVRMLINNYIDEDREYLSALLEGISIECDNSFIWHRITKSILDSDLPDEFFIWIYESTICSVCRESAIKKLLSRESLPPKYVEECKWDANLDIRKLFINVVY